MQEIEIEEQEPEHEHNRKHHPASHDEAHEGTPVILDGQVNNCGNISAQVEASGRDHNDKRSVILRSHAVVDPHAVMVKILNAAITLPTVFGSCCYVSHAIVAIEQVLNANFDFVFLT